MTEAEAQLMELVYKDPTGATAAYMIKEALKNPEKAHLTCDALLRAVDFSVSPQPQSTLCSWRRCQSRVGSGTGRASPRW